MKLPALARISVVCLIAAGCASVVPGATPTRRSPAASIAVPPAAPESHTAQPTAAPTAAPTLSPTPARPRPTSEEPPAAALGTSDFAVTGKLGTYCWSTGCVDTAGFYKATTPSLTVDEGDPLIFSLDDGEFASWSASYGVDESAPMTLGRGGDAVDPDSTLAPPERLTFVEFDAPPPGDWIVEVFVRFEDSSDAAYGWHVTVE
jgi:hypothetical protein